MRHRHHAWLAAFWLLSPRLSATALAQGIPDKAVLRLNEREYFSKPGVDVMAFQDNYPEGHQGGVTIVQHGVRVATNGDLRLEPTPGQWAPVPKMGERTLDRKANTITTKLAYPDPDKDRKGFNPIEYPDLTLRYDVHVKAEGSSVRITVDLDQALPAAWAGKVGFNLELYPATLFGKAWQLDGSTGLFPRQPNGPGYVDGDKGVTPVAYAIGKKLVIAPESDSLRMTIETGQEPLQLLDGRIKHQNGWFVVRSTVPANATKHAIDWLVTPHAIPNWKYKPVVHVSQIGYHPEQTKTAVIELDASDRNLGTAILVRAAHDGKPERALAARVAPWGEFLRYRYAQFDFSSVQREGLYWIEYGTSRTEPFRISRDLYQRHVWQPTLEYFLPVQMCHMRVNEGYRVWHGLCHMDDARMAPVSRTHFDGYAQDDKTLTKFGPLEAVPGLNVGGWHDAGDDDLRVESQVGEVYAMALAFEAFRVTYDATSIDQVQHQVEIHQPDGRPDLLQQIEHGMLSVTGAYKSLGRLYRGIISPTLRQYVLSGDVSNQTDNLVFNPKLHPTERTGTHSGRQDDRLVFTEDNPTRQLGSVPGLAAASRALRGYNDALSAQCLQMAQELWKAQYGQLDESAQIQRVWGAIELFLTTRGEQYRQYLVANQDFIEHHAPQLGWVIGRALPLVTDSRFALAIRAAITEHVKNQLAETRRNPFGVPYQPIPWGAGWWLLRFGMEQYYLHKSFPDLVGREPLLHALQFVLGCHPGENTASFASGVGARSMTTAYGYNRADWSYIPGGVVSGTALVRPDFPELKDFPYLWQQAEYVIGGGASHFMFLVLAADQVLSAPRPR